MMSIATRVGTFAQRGSLVQQMMMIQKRLYEADVQLNTEKKSQDYAGISGDSFRLVTLENDKTRTQRFIQTNTIANTRLESMAAATDAVDKRIRTMRSELQALTNQTFSNPLNQGQLDNLEDIQVRAFAAMQDVADYLNTKLDGRYLFAGGRTSEPPVDLAFTTLNSFQATYDGANITFPVTRAANVPDIALSNNEHGGLTFAAGPPSTITATTAASVNGIQPGTLIRLDDPDIGDTQFTVTANDGAGVLTITPSLTGPQAVTLNADAADATLQTVSYYGGDSLVIEHRVSDTRTIDLGLNAKAAGFEKAIRALGILAQGGLDASDTTTAAGTTGTLTFANGTSSVTAATAGSFDGLAIGSSITFPGTALNNAQTFTITGNDGTTLTLDPPPNNEAAVASDAVSNNLGRLDYALRLLGDAIEHDSSFTQEQSGDLEGVARTIGMHQVTLNRAIKEDQGYEVFLETRQTDIENVNLIEVGVRLQDEANALQMSFQAYARISQLSLQDYL
ncbi:hypothetical protein [Roseospira visakhapatnamensis]|uniref:Flagellin n=1 Tax=Roseospira visakhapatnamensis TaxID=390880 RepID=A0A7W6R9J7_9PROT|nr:hypothetical protein [Roseospira visakhapatnamensis]MBB4264431.1 hypothetical protein [Roseospira visakhapatnamensis]